MQFLVPYNYGKIVVGLFKSNDWVSVTTGDDFWENLPYGGSRTLSECNDGIFGHFRLNPGYRSGDMEHWVHTSDEGTLLVNIREGYAMIVVDEGGMPVLINKSAIADL